MSFFNRRKLFIIPLVLYWPAIFVLTHIPLPAGLLRNIHTSDKVLHYLAYLVLSFLAWFAVSPQKKVNWLKPILWWVLVIITIYAAMDEWLQGFVNRDPDVGDFLANIAGVLSGLVLLSFLPFWLASLGLTAGLIFVIASFLAQADLAGQFLILDISAYAGLYALFTLFWIKAISELAHLEAPQLRWLAGAALIPLIYLLLVELFVLFVYGQFRLFNFGISSAAIAIVVMAHYIGTIIKNRACE